MAHAKIKDPLPDDYPQLLRCNICQQTKPRDEFGRSRTRGKRLHLYECRQCNSEITIRRQHRKEAARDIDAFDAATQRLIAIVAKRMEVSREFRKSQPSDNGQHQPA